MIQMLKALWKEMLKPMDGKKTNWWINGFMLIVLILVFIGVISYGN